MAVNYIPDGYGTVTPYLAVKNVEKLMEFVTKVFDAKELYRMPGPDGRVGHAEMQIGNSRVMVGEAPGADQVMTAMLCIYVPDCDDTYNKALIAGATSIRGLQDQFYGDRSGAVIDPCGNQWFISTHIEDVSEEEMIRRASAVKH